MLFQLLLLNAVMLYFALQFLLYVCIAIKVLWSTNYIDVCLYI